MNKTLKIPAMLHRSGGMEEAEDGTMRLSISSDEPYERYDWMNDERYLEVLDHSPSGPDLSRLKGGAALLYNHDRNILLGTLSDPQCRNGRCYVKAKLSDAADVASYRTKIKEGILKDTSIGYNITSDGEKIGERDGVPIYRFKFAVHEASFVTIPADTSVGAGRQRADDTSAEMREVIIKNENVLATDEKITQQRAMPDETATTQAPRIEVTRSENDTVAAFKVRCKKIDEFVNGIDGFPEWKQEVIVIANRHKDGDAHFDGPRGFHEEALKAFKRPAPLPAQNLSEGMSARDLSKYSILNAINGVLGSTQGKRFDGLEREMSDEVARKNDRKASSLGFFLPNDFMLRGTASPMTDYQRTLFATGNFTAAGALVPIGPQGQAMIDLYRNKMHVVAMGAQVLSGLQGTLAIPRQTGGATVAWLAEDATITASNQAVGQLTLTPHRLAAATAFSSQLLAQSSPDIENFVRNDLMTVLAVEKDRVALLGTGSAGEPLGVYNTPNIAATVDITATSSITYVEAVQFETNVAAGNADLGSLGYITSVFIRGTARCTAKFANTGMPLWDGDMLGSYPARATNQLTAVPSVMFGNWADMIIGDWLSPEIIVDPYSLSMANQVRIVVHQLTDVGIRHPKSFCFGVV